MGYANTKWITPEISSTLSSWFPSTFSATFGEAVGGVTDALGGFGSEFGAQAAAQGAAGAGVRAAQQTAMQEGVKAGLAGETGAALQETVADSLRATLGGSHLGDIGAAFSAPGLTEAGIQSSAERIASKITSDIAPRSILGFGLPASVTKASQAILPQGLGLTNVLGGQPIGEALLGRTVGDVVGGFAGSALTSQIPTSFQSQEDRGEALAAWNERYDYTPTEQELYTFYTNEFIPNQQVNRGIVSALPGYQTAAAAAPNVLGARVPNILGAGIPNVLGLAGGGYLNGVGGPRSDSNLARLSDGEFVMTEAAVRGAGEGDRMAGARRMYDLMNGLERRAA